jgi:hypothetical protein
MRARPFKLTDHQKRGAIKRSEQGETLPNIGRSYSGSPATISRLATDTRSVRFSYTIIARVR